MAGSRWKIQLINGSEVKELLLNTEPLPTWPFGTLGDVGKINVLSTRNFKVESTPESDVFFEHMGKFNVVGTIQKRENFLTLLYDNEPVIENARVNKLSFENNQYSIILSGDNGVLISKLNSGLEVLDWSSYSDDYDPTSQAAGLALDPFTNFGFIYSLSIFNAQSSSSIIESGEYLLPCFKLETILNRILFDNGLSIVNLSSVQFYFNDDFLTQYIQLTNARMPVDGKTVTKSSFGGVDNIVTIPSSGSFDIVMSQEITNYWNNDNFKPTAVYWIRPIYNSETTTISITFNEIQNPLTSYTVSIIEERSGGFILNGATVNTAISTTQTFTFNNTEAGNAIGVRVVIAGAPVQDLKFSFELSATANIDIVPYDSAGFNIKFEDNLPDIKQIDIIKYIANYYSLLVDFDTVNNSIIFYDYTSLIEKYNNDEYIDITSIIVNPSTIKIDDQGNLAKSNYLNHSNEDDVKETDGRGVYVVANANLPTTRSSYDSPFAYSATLGETAIIPYIQQETSDPTYSFTGLGGIRLVNVVALSEDGVTYKNYSQSNYVNLQYAVDTYYTDFNASNEDFKILSISVLADWTTIKEMVSKSEKLPILIDYNDGKTQINGVFKLNKISSWSDKKPTQIELKKLI